MSYCARKQETDGQKSKIKEAEKLKCSFYILRDHPLQILNEGLLQSSICHDTKICLPNLLSVK